MESTTEDPRVPENKEPETMKSLSLGIVGDLGRLFKEHGLGQNPIHIIEALVFAMFVVTETFTFAKKGLQEAQQGLDLFHEDMVEYIFREYVFKKQKAKDLEEVKARFDQLHELINERYQEYWRNFMEDYHDKHMTFRRTFNSLAGHLFREPLTADEGKDRLMAAFSVKLAHFWSGCLSSFQPAPD